MEEHLRALLLADAGLRAMVAGRVDWGASPQGAPLPGLVLTVVSKKASHTHSGPARHTGVRVQIDAYAAGFGEAKRLARAVRAALDGHRGGALQGAFFAGSSDGREGGANEAVRPWRVRQDFMIHWTEESAP